MTTEGTSVQAVLAALEAEGHVAPGRRDEAAAALARLDETQPWYLRAMTGFGAWLASLLFISFVMGLSLFATDGGFLATGILFVAAAAIARHRLDNDFSNQAALAMSLAGQVLFAVGVGKSATLTDVEAPLLALLALNAVLIPLYPDRVHRFLSVVFMTAAFVGLLYKWEEQAILTFLAPALAAASVRLAMGEGYSITRRRDGLLRPVTAGLMASAFGCVMISTIYLLPELAHDFQFYPRPWISTLGFGLLLLYLQRCELPPAFGGVNSRAAVACYVLTALLIIAALPAPGLVLSVAVMLLGAARGDRIMTGAGIAFLAVFTVAFFYAIETTLLLKSLTLIASGAVVLLARWWLLRLLRAKETTGYA